MQSVEVVLRDLLMVEMMYWKLSEDLEFPGWARITVR